MKNSPTLVGITNEIKKKGQDIMNEIKTLMKLKMEFRILQRFSNQTNIWGEN